MTVNNNHMVTNDILSHDSKSHDHIADQMTADHRCILLHTGYRDINKTV